MKQPRVIGAGRCLVVLLIAGCGGVGPTSTASLPGVTAPQGSIGIGTTQLKRPVSVAPTVDFTLSHRSRPSR